jgi:hypothetical protein
MTSMLRWFLILLVAAGAWAQNLRPEQTMVMLIGQSADRPSADQQAVLQRLKALRQQPAFKQLKIGMMHFDRPAEAKFARQVLGIDASQLPCLCLVQLDSKMQRPVKNLYAMPRVTRAQLEQVEQMAQVWAQTASQHLPLAGKDRIVGGQTLPLNGTLTSLNGLYTIALQSDGNLVITRKDLGRPIWSSETDNDGATALTLGNDGILRLMAPEGRVVWQSQGGGSLASYYFQMQDDGNAVVYRQDGRGFTFIWATQTTIR